MHILPKFGLCIIKKYDFVRSTAHPFSKLAYLLAKLKKVLEVETLLQAVIDGTIVDIAQHTDSPEADPIEIKSYKGSLRAKPIRSSILLVQHSMKILICPVMCTLSCALYNRKKVKLWFTNTLKFEPLFEMNLLTLLFFLSTQDTYQCHSFVKAETLNHSFGALTKESL